MMREVSTASGDGTALVSWHGAASGPPVLVCGAIGAPAQSWPELTAVNAGLHALGWHYRGTYGSAKPADATRIALDDHVADAIAVLDAAGIEHTPVIGWSSGATIAAELARRLPDRITGLMMIAGPPGDLLATIRGPWGAAADLVTGLFRGPARQSPLRARGLVGRVTSGGLDALRLSAPMLAATLPRLPVEQLTMVLRRSGVLLPTSDPRLVAEVLRPFLRLDWDWYPTLLQAIGSVPPLAIADLRCPVTAMVGRHDLVSDRRALIQSVGPLPQARLRILDASHFIPLEAPDEILAETSLLVERASGVQRALHRRRIEHVAAP